jgi:hypothetical protein
LGLPFANSNAKNSVGYLDDAYDAMLLYYKHGMLQTASRRFLAVVQAEHVILHIVVPWALHQMEHLHHKHNVNVSKKTSGHAKNNFSNEFGHIQTITNRQIHTKMIKVIHEFKTIITKAKT